MPLSCHGALGKIKGETDFTFALAGNPNVGKSSIFNYLTGMGVVTANYPGKTVEVNMAVATLDHLRIGIIDLPGTYALGAVSEDQWVARQAVLDGQPDAVVMIVDATNLARNLYMVLQFLDLELPVVVALNLVDQAEREGLSTDAGRLAELLGVPVVPTVATQGRGLDELMRTAVEMARQRSGQCRRPRYGHDVEERITRLAAHLGAMDSEAGGNLAPTFPYTLSPRALAVLLLESDAEFVTLVKARPDGGRTIDLATGLAGEIERAHGQPASLRLAQERHGVAGAMAAAVQTAREQGLALEQRLWRLTTSPATGLPLMLLTLGVVFVLLFYVGGLLSAIFGQIWGSFVSPLIDAPFYFLFGDSPLARTFIWGFDGGIEAALEVGVPYVLTFYLLLAILEDSGYLNSVAFLTDRIMHHLGLHGRAVIPLVAGAGCNVPAIIGTRVLTTMRERIVASTLIVLMPCSARTAVIMGAVSLFVGWRPAVAIYVIVFIMIAVVGWGLNRVMPGQSTGLVMEMFPFRAPSPLTIAKKTWHRFHDFIFVAAPIVVVGSLVLGGLYETGYIWKLSAPLSPVVEGWLGLPAVAGLTLIFAVLRKELALQLLVTLAAVQFGRDSDNLLQFMSPRQIFVYALVNTIYIPCVATIAVLGRELRWRRAVPIMVFTIALAILIGGLADRALAILGWL